MMIITPIPAFDDNYIWLISNECDSGAYVVDPGDGVCVLKVLEEKKLTLSGILITHWHPDHTGGIEKLVSRYQCPVYGPQSSHITSITDVLADGEQISVFGHPFEVIALPGHTLDHISYFCSDSEIPVVFCGDTLFVGGCGRLFEGTALQMYQSLNKLAALPSKTRVYCAHEYTLSNLQFANTVEPDNLALQKLTEDVVEAREQGIATVPSSIEQELATNPFLRSAEPAVIIAAQQYKPNMPDANEAVFATLREWKDDF